MRTAFSTSAMWGTVGLEPENDELPLTALYLFLTTAANVVFVSCIGILSFMGLRKIDVSEGWSLGIVIGVLQLYHIMKLAAFAARRKSDEV